MIAQLQGIVVEKGPEEAIIDVGGVGYRVFISLLTLEKLPDIGQPCRLLIHTQVREDAFHLYGFTSSEERNLFKFLNNVNGIGPRLALAILSTMTPQVLVTSIVAEDVMALVRVPGIGKKIAQRIVMELKDRLAHLSMEGEQPVAVNKSVAPTNKQTLLSALLNLGYKRNEAMQAIQSLPPEALADISLGIRSALKVLAQ
ncbi:MAG: Holliday junction branch migration protein RuvA [Magnetococcus sp. THC-1_WYH]